MARYRVTGAYVTVKTNTTNGPTVVGLYEGAPVPPDATPAWVEHHLANRLIEEVPGTAEEPTLTAAPGPTPRQAAPHRAKAGATHA
jgi:hypothetical protein